MITARSCTIAPEKDIKSVLWNCHEETAVLRPPPLWPVYAPEWSFGGEAGAADEHPVGEVVADAPGKLGGVLEHVSGDAGVVLRKFGLCSNRCSCTSNHSTTFSR